MKPAMTPDEIVKSIEKHHLPTKPNHSTLLTFKGGKEVGGFFDGFDDSEELRKEKKYRFITTENMAAHLKDPENKDYSIVIDVKNLHRIDLVFRSGPVG